MRMYPLHLSRYSVRDSVASRNASRLGQSKFFDLPGKTEDGEAATHRTCRCKDISRTVKKRAFRRSGWRKKGARGLIRPEWDTRGMTRCPRRTGTYRQRACSQLQFRSSVLQIDSHFPEKCSTLTEMPAHAG